MNFWFIVCAILLVKINYSLTNSDEDEDSSEYGVVEGSVGTNCTCGYANKEGERIIGGEEAKRNEWPMIAEFSTRGSHFCGGTVVTKRHIVTAAHCGFWPNSLRKLRYNKINIHLGIHEVHGERAFLGGQVLGIDQFIAHPDYSNVTYRNDIAVIYLNGDIDFGTKNVAPACLPLGNEQVTGEYLKVLGWGAPNATSRRGTPSLMKVNLKAVDHKMCKSKYKYYHEDSHICTYAKNKDSCRGDSGGPLLWRDPETNRYVLVAATSYGGICGTGPGVNSKITHFLAWIQSTIEATDSSHRTCSKTSS